MADYTTQFGSLAEFSKGGVDVLDDDPRRYAFSNLFEVAAGARPWEKIAVAMNAEYVLEVIRAEGASAWRATPHDEFALVMAGEVEVELLAPESSLVDPSASGSVGLEGQPEGRPMGRVRARKGHMTLLPAGRCYRFRAEQPGVILLQTIAGPDTQFRWDEICQSERKRS